MPICDRIGALTHFGKRPSGPFGQQDRFAEMAHIVGPTSGLAILGGLVFQVAAIVLEGFGEFHACSFGGGRGASKDLTRDDSCGLPRAVGGDVPRCTFDSAAEVEAAIKITERLARIDSLAVVAALVLELPSQPSLADAQLQALYLPVAQQDRPLDPLH